ncbi:Lar family restriction alleviation protein [Salmonella enterica]|nr:Lar family restriction alleviation protein [Salmonella enterica]
MTENTLLPCPFCGGQAEQVVIEAENDPNFGGSVIACSGCGASSHIEFGFKEGLVSAWNARAELQERRNADGAEPVSFDSLNAAVAEVTGCNQHTWNAAIYKGHHPVPSMNYNSLARIVDMYRSPQPTPAISCPKPVVKLPTTRCWSGISNFYYAADVIAAIRAAGVEVSND